MLQRWAIGIDNIEGEDRPYQDHDPLGIWIKAQDLFTITNKAGAELEQFRPVRTFSVDISEQADAPDVRPCVLESDYKALIAAYEKLLNELMA